MVIGFVKTTKLNELLNSYVRKMFHISIKRLLYACDKIVTRNIRSRRLDSVPVANPGLQRRIDALREDGVTIKDHDAEEIVEQYDSDFKNMGQVYNEHLNETMIGKHELRHHIVKEKYFKENMPNLLTWSEKEQIRHLANTLPDEWTPERIAESFPVTAEVAKKLLKYPWKPASEQRIQRHDSSAMRNWREIKEGTLDIPENLRQHFLKFLERTIPPLNKKSIKIDLTNSAKIGEFERIIQKCADKDENAEQNDNETSFHTTNETGISVQNHRDKTEKRDRKRITLEDLTARIQKRLEQGKDVDMPDKLILDCVNAKDIESAKNDNEMRNEVELAIEENESDVAIYKEKNEVVVSPEVKYPLRIRIPKKAYKKGATYKVNDCYYDHDGKFLYRVIGMSN